MKTTRRAFIGTGASALAFWPASGIGTKEKAQTFKPFDVEEVPTPALLLDLDAFEWNVTKMASSLKAANRAFRPHGKTHKCPEIAKALVKAGAVGSCVAKLSEAEVFASHGIGGLLVTTAVIGKAKIERAIRLASRNPDTIFVVDHVANIRDLNDAAGLSGLRLNLAIDLLIGRTGVEMGQPALELAQMIDSLPHVQLAGLQSYDGGASHTNGFEKRKIRSQETMARAVETRRLIEQSGIACPLVTGGSTGTYNIDTGVEGVTEHQPGSFMFMDLDYNQIGGMEGSEYNDFRSALTVLTTVVSQRPGVAIVDGGFKAFSTDRSFGPRPVEDALREVPYSWAGDEHGRLDLTNAGREVKVGDRIEWLVPHCDPTVNLYNTIHCVRNGRVEAMWEVSARGMSQ